VALSEVEQEAPVDGEVAAFEVERGQGQAQQAHRQSLWVGRGKLRADLLLDLGKVEGQD